MYLWGLQIHIEYPITRLTGVAYPWATNVGESRKYKSKIE